MSLMPFLVYLHGYNSSPLSLKAQQTKQWLKENKPELDFVCPALSPFPLQAIAQIETFIAERTDKLIGFVGSSMGGFYSTLFAEKHDSKAVLINPAVDPHLLVPKYLGQNTNYHTGEPFTLTPQHVHDFLSLQINTLQTPENLLVLLQTGDEVLDYHHAEKKYSGGHFLIEKGGDHSFQNYQQHIPKIISFFDY